MDKTLQPPVNTASLGGKVMYTMEEWDAMHPIPVRPSVPLKVAKQQQLIRPLPPVQVTGEVVAKVNHLCQLHSVTPCFTFEEIAKGCFTARVEFGDCVCEDEGPFPSKKQAKDAVCRSALAILEKREPPRKEKRKTLDRAGGEASFGADLEDENWVSQLVEFAQSRRSTTPFFESFEKSMRGQQMSGQSIHSKSFACTVRLAAVPEQVFGSETAFYSNKAEAKRHAAREAVLWLRANGLLSAPAREHRSKRRQSSDDQGSDTSMEIRPDISPAKQVAEYSLRLGFTQPRFEMKPCAQSDGGLPGPGFYNAAAFYIERDVQREPRLQGPLFQHQRSLGRRARRRCAAEI
ncbi:hypothetical protein WHR41_01762 [Cladosporium halotolerans]|uniref:DRBM domain-containing protein n=1 Tax=Cladosporium halotolerans TaxID=1052096 RepID=A0AB34KXJ2_9PEZI